MAVHLCIHMPSLRVQVPAQKCVRVFKCLLVTGQASLSLSLTLDLSGLALVPLSLSLCLTLLVWMVVLVSSAGGAKKLISWFTLALI